MQAWCSLLFLGNYELFKFLIHLKLYKSKSATEAAKKKLHQFLGIFFRGDLGTSGGLLLVQIILWGLTWWLFWHLLVV